MGTPSHELSLPFPYFKGFMEMGVPLLGVPGISLDIFSNDSSISPRYTEVMPHALPVLPTLARPAKPEIPRFQRFLR